MTYTEFTEELRERIISELHCEPDAIKFYPEGFTSEDPSVFDWIIDTNKKFSGKESPFLLKDFLVIEHEPKNLTSLMHRISLRDVYDKSEADGFDEAFAEIMNSVEGVRSSSFDTETLSKRGSADYEDMKSHLILRPLNYGMHMNELKEYVYNRTADIAFVLYHLIGDAKKSLATSKITREELERWGMSDRRDEVMSAALENTARLFPACVYDNRMGKETDFMSAEISRENMVSNGLIILSTFKVTNGAIALFYPNVAEKMRKIMGGSFLAVFMNINDALIFERNDSTAWRYASAAKNSRSDEYGEMLSARVFLCDEKGINPA